MLMWTPGPRVATPPMGVPHVEQRPCVASSVSLLPDLLGTGAFDRMVGLRPLPGRRVRVGPRLIFPSLLPVVSRYQMHMTDST